MSTTDTLAFLARGIAIIVALLLVAALYLGQDVLIPIVLAGLFCFVLSPIVNRLECWRLPRIPAAVLTCALAFAVVGALAYVVAGQVLDLAYQLPSYKENMRQKIAALQLPSEGPVGNLTRTFTELRAEALKGAKPAAAVPNATGALDPQPAPAVPVEVVNDGGSFADLAQQLAAPVLGPIGTAAVVAVFVLFMLLKKEDLRNRVIHLAGRSRLSLTTRTLEEAGARVSRYLLMQLVVNVTYGIPIGVGLWFIGVPNALLWGVLTAIVRFLPYIGPWIGAFFPLALSLAVSTSWTMPLLVVALFIVVELLSNNVMEPWLYGSSTGLSPVAILVAAVFWTWLWGAVGLVLATPLTVCLAVLGKHVPALAFLDVLLGDQPAMPASDRYYQRLLARDEAEAAKVLAEYEMATSRDRALGDLLALAVLSGEADHESGALDDAGYTFLLATVRKHAVHEQFVQAPGADAATPPDVLIIPAEDEGDEVVGVILGELLGAKVRTRVLAHQTLTNEKAAAASESGAPVICISDTALADAPRARFLGRLLRKRDITAFVFTGLWSLSDEESNLTALAERFSADQAGTNLFAARDALRGWVVQPSVLSQTSPAHPTSPPLIPTLATAP